MALFNAKFFSSFLVGCLSIFMSSSSYSLDSATAPVIMITPTRTLQTENTSSSTVYVVDRHQINRSGASTTSELLRGIPGIQIDDLFGNGVEVSISLRGFSSSANANTLILVNGRRLNHGDTASPDLHHIFPRDIERIEVLVGSSGTLYGDQAVGGVVNIITRKTAQDYTQTELSLGSFNYRSAQFLTSGKKDRLGYRFTAEQFQSDHYRDHNEESNVNAHGLLQYSAGNHEMFVELQRIEGELELPGALLQDEFDADPTQSNAGFRDDFINEDTDVVSMGYQHKWPARQFSVDLTQRKTDAEVRQSFRNTPSPANGFTSRQNMSLNPKLSGVYSSTDFELPYVAGIDLEHSEYELFLPNAFGVSTAENDQQIHSLFFQLHPQLTEKLQLTLGMRHSSLDKDMKDGFSFPAGLNIEDDVQVGEIGLVYRPNESIKWSFRVDENFRFAKINELAQAEPGQILDTQTGRSFETGLDWRLGDHHLSASIYRLDLENEIVFDPTAGADFGSGPIGANVNLRKTRRDGLTVLLASRIDATLTVSTELGLVDARYQSGTFGGKDISGVADRVLKLRADYMINKPLSMYIEAHHKGEHFAQGDNANAFDKVASINVINLGLKLEIKKLQLSLRVNNLADRKYAEFITNNGFGAAFQPSPERNYLMTASYQFE